MAAVARLRAPSPPAADPGEAVRRDIEALAELSFERPELLAAAPPAPVLRDALPVLVAEARRACAPAEPAEIVNALLAFARRHRVDPPDETALELDAEIISGWPRDLWRRAFRTLWEGWTFRRMPTAGDFRAPIAADLDGRRQRLRELLTLHDRIGRRGHRPRGAADCVAALRAAGPGTRLGWYHAACRRDPALAGIPPAAVERWADAVAPRIAEVGLLGPTAP
jgi:hypothetical protein